MNMVENHKKHKTNNTNMRTVMDEYDLLIVTRSVPGTLTIFSAFFIFVSPFLKLNL